MPRSLTLPRNDERPRLYRWIVAVEGEILRVAQDDKSRGVGGVDCRGRWRSLAMTNDRISTGGLPRLRVRSFALLRMTSPAGDGGQLLGDLHDLQHLQCFLTAQEGCLGANRLMLRFYFDSRVYYSTFVLLLQVVLATERGIRDRVEASHTGRVRTNLEPRRYWVIIMPTHPRETNQSHARTQE